MHNDAATLLAALIGGRGRAELRLLRATVTAYREDGGVNLNANGALITGALCLAAYTHRAVGDVVQVAAVNGVWVVLGKYGADSTFTLPKTSYQGTRQYRLSDMHSVNVDDVSGFSKIGASGIHGDNSPTCLAWGFYDGTNNTLTQAVTAAGVTKCTVTLARVGSPHGSSQGVALELIPHNHNGFPTVLVPVTGLTPVVTKLQWGQIVNLSLPSDWVSGIQGGTVKGYFLQPQNPTIVGNAGYALMSPTSGGFTAA